MCEVVRGTGKEVEGALGPPPPLVDKGLTPLLFDSGEEEVLGLEVVPGASPTSSSAETLEFVSF